MSKSNNLFKEQPKGFATKAIHVGQNPDQWDHLSVVPPIVTVATFKQYAPGEPKVLILYYVFIFVYTSLLIV